MGWGVGGSYFNRLAGQTQRNGFRVSLSDTDSVKHNPQENGSGRWTWKGRGGEGGGVCAINYT